MDANKKTSTVWNFFELEYMDDSTAFCRLCSNDIFCGKPVNRKSSTFVFRFVLLTFFAISQCSKSATKSARI